MCGRAIPEGASCKDRNGCGCAPPLHEVNSAFLATLPRSVSVVSFDCPEIAAFINGFMAHHMLIMGARRVSNNMKVCWGNL